MNSTTTTQAPALKKRSIMTRPWVQSLLILTTISGLLGGFIYWQLTKDVIKIDTSYLDAPVVHIAATSGGALNALYVREGEQVPANTPVALVGAETIYAKETGIVSSAPEVLGAFFAPGQTVVSIVANQKMRLVGTLDETGGLDKVAPGQRVSFTVDAFPGRTYQAVVDEVSPTSSATGVVFSISDKRPVKQFNVYMRFDSTRYPELKTGMSARAWVHLK